MKKLCLLFLITMFSHTYTTFKFINKNWEKFVDTRRGLGDVSRYTIETDVGNENSIYTLVHFKRKPYIYKYDNEQSMWVAHTTTPFEAHEKNQTIRVQSDGTLYSVCDGRVYRWSTTDRQWKKIAGNKTGLPKRKRYIITDVTQDGSAWALVVFKRKKPRLYRFDQEKNMWTPVGTADIDGSIKHITLRAHTNNEVYVAGDGTVVKWNSWRNTWFPITNTKKGLPQSTKLFMMDVGRDNSAWAVATFKRKPSHLYFFDKEKNYWIPNAVLPLDSKDKDHNVRIHPDGVFVTADGVVHKLRRWQ